MHRLRRFSLSLLLGLFFTTSSHGAIASEETRLQQALTLIQKGRTSAALQVIESPAPTPPLTPTQGRTAFLRATLIEKLQGREASVSDFQTVWRTYPPLADYAANVLAQAAADRRDLDTLAQLVPTLAERYPDSRHVPTAYLLLAQTQHRLGHVAQARATVAHILQTYSAHPAAPKALMLRAQLEEEAGQIAAAALTFKHVGETYPRHDQAPLAFKRSRQLFKRLPSNQRPQLDPEDEFPVLQRLLKARRWPELQRRLKALRPLVQATPSHPRLLLMQAIVAQKQRRLPHAITLLKRLLVRYPQSPERAEAHYRLAQLYRRRGRQKYRHQRETHLRHAMAQHHDTVWAPKAALKLAQMFEQQQDLSQASDLYRHVGDHYPDHEEAVPSLWQAAWLQYRQGHYDQAEQMWRRMATQFPSGIWHPKALYWLARTVAHRGDLSNAQALYQRVAIDFPYTYHGFQARQQLRHLAVPVPSFIAQEQAHLPWEQRPPVSLSSPLIADPSPEQVHLIRARELQQLQMYRRARREIDILEHRLPQTHATQHFIANLLADNQEHLAALKRLNQIVAELTPLQIRGLSRDFWMMLYPQRYLDIIAREAAPHLLSSELILSLIRQESVFNPRATSRVGARGLMQLMPATARLVARQTGRKRPRLTQLFDPETNIALGTYYFAAQLRRFHDNPVFALAAYNAGPHRVDKWRQRWPHLPMDEFIEHIPFEETRLYVKLILRNLSIYESLYRPLPDA